MESISTRLCCRQHCKDDYRVTDNDVEIPKYLERDLALEFEKLKQYGLISNYCYYISECWEITILPSLLTYFERKEKAILQEKQSYNTNNFYGDVTGVQIQQGTVNSSQTQTITQDFDYGAISDIIENIKKYDGMFDAEFGDKASELRGKIAGLEGIYAEIRDLVYSRDRIMKQHNISANRIQRWLAIHFPEYLGLYTRFDAISGLAVLEKAPLPKDVIALGVNGIRKIWHDKKMRGRGVTEDRAKTLVEAAHNSVGLDGGIGTKSELYMLLEEHRLWTSQLEAVNKVLEEMILKVPHVEKLLAIKGVGSITIAGFIAEVGDIRRFDSPKQIQKYAGLELLENSSGKHKGRTRISKRGRRKLRKILYQVMVPLLARNKEFRGIYDYYVTRVKNPLKRRQAMVAVSCKLIRVFYAVLTKGVEYD